MQEAGRRRRWPGREQAGYLIRALAFIRSQALTLGVPRVMPFSLARAHFFMQSIMNFQRASCLRFFSFACV